MKKNEILEEILAEVDKHPEIMSRRDAMKYLTVSPMAAAILAGATAGTTEVEASDVKGKVVIVGGGLAGGRGIAAARAPFCRISCADKTDTTFSEVLMRASILAKFPPGFGIGSSATHNMPEEKFSTAASEHAS